MPLVGIIQRCEDMIHKDKDLFAIIVVLNYYGGTGAYMNHDMHIACFLSQKRQG